MSDVTYSIQAERLSKRFGPVTALDGVSFCVGHGEVIGFLGPNGAGKSTTLRILSGLIPATSGVARICGTSVAQKPQAIKRSIGYMPENNPLPVEMRVAEYLRFRARLKGLTGKAVNSAVEEAMERCELHRKASRKLIGSLSKGFRQRVGVADAIVARPRVAILDEPTIGLDPHQVLLMRELIRSLRGHMTVLLSSHILSEVQVACDRVIIINQGRIVARGTLAELQQEFAPLPSYHVVVQGPPKAIVKALHSVDTGCTVHPNGEAVEAQFIPYKIKSQEAEDQSEAYLQALTQYPGLRIRSLYREKASLEDIFLVATRRSWEVTQDEILQARNTQPPIAVESKPTPAEPIQTP